MLRDIKIVAKDVKKMPTDFIMMPKYVQKYPKNKTTPSDAV